MLEPSRRFCCCCCRVSFQSPESSWNPARNFLHTYSQFNASGLVLPSSRRPAERRVVPSTWWRSFIKSQVPELQEASKPPLTALEEVQGSAIC